MEKGPSTNCCRLSLFPKTGTVLGNKDFKDQLEEYVQHSKEQRVHRSYKEAKPQLQQRDVSFSIRVLVHVVGVAEESYMLPAVQEELSQEFLGKYPAWALQLCSFLELQCQKLRRITAGTSADPEKLSQGVKQKENAW